MRALVTARLDCVSGDHASVYFETRVFIPSSGPLTYPACSSPPFHPRPRPRPHYIPAADSTRQHQQADGLDREGGVTGGSLGSHSCPRCCQRARPIQVTNVVPPSQYSGSGQVTKVT
ncbi:hypothetical protein E2C01_079467 [Portunus trituberculatus]|uniref:Uncharacterized protein n=1 Tax=Portunus trituberculatus TaxID=210409 RepID=A0A5B7IJM4_PORTR|nr:hypothetical protein [Portunus trituberculatus]